MSDAKPLRLLVLAPFAPRLDAPHGGGRSIAQLVTELALRHRVALLALRPEGDPPTDDSVRERCELVEEFPVPGVGSSAASRWKRRARLLYGLARGRPMWVVDCWVPALAARLEELVRSWRPDVVQAEFHVMGQYLESVRDTDAARVVTQHEPGASAAAEAWRARGGPARLLGRVDALAWARFETRLLTRVDASVAFTDRDRDLLARLAPGARIVRIPLGGVVEERPHAEPTESNSLIFVGNFMHPPNVEAAQRLVHEILPRVLREARDTRLYIVGDRAPASLRGATSEHVTVTGFVRELAPYLARAALVVVPIRTGGGQRVKVIDALAAGKPLVASRLAIEGFDLTDGENVLVAETDDEFATAVIRLLADAEERAALGSNARAWAEQNLGWARTIDDYEGLYRKLLRGGTTRPPR